MIGIRRRRSWGMGSRRLFGLRVIWCKLSLNYYFECHRFLILSARNTASPDMSS